MVKTAEVLSSKPASQILYPELGQTKTVLPNKVLFQNSIKKADVVEDTAPSRPRLSSKPLVKQMISAQEYGSQVTQQLAEMSKTSFMKECEKYKSFTHEAIEAFMQQKDSEESAASWSYFRQLISYLGSSISFAAGGFALGSGGGGWAVVLLCAGGANVFNEIMRVTGGWEKLASYFGFQAENAQRIATGLQMSVGAAAALGSIVSGYALVNVLQMANAAETATLIANTAGSLAGGVASIAEGNSRKKMLEAEEKHLHMQARSSDHRAEVYRTTENIKELAKKDERSLHAASELMEIQKHKIQTIAASAA